METRRTPANPGLKGAISVTGEDKERVTSDYQKTAAHWSRYIVYPLLVVGIFLGVIAIALGMYSGIPLLASVGCFFGAWLTHTRSPNYPREKADAMKMFFIFLGFVFAAIAKAIND
jgi:hypothetical protein